MGEIRIGDEVLAPWLNDGYVYPAVVVAIQGPAAHVAYLDGAEADVPLAGLVRGAFGPGLGVQVNWKGRGSYYPGTIAGRVGQALFVYYADGAREWTTVGQCRIQKEIAATLRPGEITCEYCGARRSDDVATCPQCGATRRR